MYRDIYISVCIYREHQLNSRKRHLLQVFECENRSSRLSMVRIVVVVVALTALTALDRLAHAPGPPAERTDGRTDEQTSRHRKLRSATSTGRALKTLLCIGIGIGIGI